jgi:hypothetical protein
MKLFIVYEEVTGKYLTQRRATKDMYVSRAGWSSDFKHCRPFTNKGAATNAARQAGGVDFTVIEGSFVVAGVRHETRGATT